VPHDYNGLKTKIPGYFPDVRLDPPVHLNDAAWWEFRPVQVARPVDGKFL
jgi:hypothetical protein